MPFHHGEPLATGKVLCWRSNLDRLRLDFVDTMGPSLGCEPPQSCVLFVTAMHPAAGTIQRCYQFYEILLTDSRLSQYLQGPVYPFSSLRVLSVVLDAHA